MKNEMIAKVLSSKSGISTLILRVPLGLILAAHGSQKLFSWFGGYGLEGTGQWMASIGFEPGYVMALLAGSGEFFGGLALLCGFLTRPAALVVAFTMAMAMSVHIGNGLFVANNGYEYALLLTVAALSLVFQGAGRYSIDQLLLNKIEQ
ncbi:DoxX family protein [Vibrio sp. DW001]|uniref:DoxX family protein n=1 Tax=Vibrio sp. DW001 TaxID=2912315 RepID=UPI0023AEB315|nr:DoxX family protein [Vibrio sp. DW001]WED28054.1 DoxX family protein [Vibrio sp. DW001]